MTTGDRKRKLAALLASLDDCDVLDDAADVLDDPGQSQPAIGGVDELIAKYQATQRVMKVPPTTKSRPAAPSKKVPVAKGKTATTCMYSINFCKFKKKGHAYRRIGGNVQISGFSDTNTYKETVKRAMRGLDIEGELETVELIVSGGLVKDAALQDGSPWSLGGYVKEIGGSSARGKKTFGLYQQDDELTDGWVTSEEQHNRLTTVSSSEHTKHDHNSLVASTEQEIILDDDTSTPVTEILVTSERMQATYCPVVEKEVCMSVRAIGINGMLRVDNLDFVSEDTKIEQDLALVHIPTLINHFVLVEIAIGDEMYLKVKNRQSVNLSVTELTFEVKDHLVHSSTTVKLTANTFTPLVCISPTHPACSYLWERKRYGINWDKIDGISSQTCLIYVNESGTFRCTINPSGASSDTLKTVTFFVRDHESPHIQREENSCCAEVLLDMSEVTTQEVVGRGTFSIVYRGTYKGREVALKKLRLLPQSFDLIKSKEVNVLRQLHHPNIVQFFGCGVEESVAVLVMEFVNGHNLHKMLFSQHKREFSGAQEAYISTSIAKAIDYLHKHDPVIIHHDIKPNNVLVSNDLKQVVLCDLGIANIKKAAESTLTCTGVGSGTIPYMAPEMFIKSRRRVSVDVYSMGCLLVELFTRRRVWHDFDQAQIMLKVCGSYHTAPSGPDLSDLSGKKHEICKKCLQLEPTARPTIGQVLENLRDL